MTTSRATGTRTGTRSPSRSSKTTPLRTDKVREAEVAGGRTEAETAAASFRGDLKAAALSASRAVQHQAVELAAEIGHELSDTAEEQKSRGVEALHGFAHAVETAADELKDQSPRVARYVRDAAEKIEDLSESIGSRDVGELLRAASHIARSRPVVFCGGAVVAGFALSRFLKSSARHTASHTFRADRQGKLHGHQG